MIPTPAAIGFPPMLDGQPLHVPTFRDPRAREGEAFCLRCEQSIPAGTFGKPCEGKTAQKKESA